ncbi:RNase P subunit p30 family protein [Natrialbaceae archaeon GCM10025810]|uniref:RNase P subunit p30 family protein n=1 Tax=Halovalidus salilacus TaxID=3075124 RepID=UPI00360B2260
MYEAVRARPDGESSVERLVETAAEYGFDGLVVRNHSDARAEYDQAALADEHGVDVVDGIEIEAENRETAGGAVGNFRNSHEIVALHGGRNDLNRFAVETDKVDVLSHPMAGSGDVNHVLVRAAVDNGVRLEFDLGGVLRESGGRRVRTIQSLRKLREIVDYYDAPYVVSAEATSHLQLRAPRELRALGERIGFDREWIGRGLEEWGRLAQRNRRIQSESFIEPGVQRGRYEEEP